MTDVLVDGATYVSGDTNEDTILDVGEVWSYAHTGEALAGAQSLSAAVTARDEAWRRPSLPTHQLPCNRSKEPPSERFEAPGPGKIERRGRSTSGEFVLTRRTSQTRIAGSVFSLIALADQSRPFACLAQPRLSTLGATCPVRAARRVFATTPHDSASILRRTPAAPIGKLPGATGRKKGTYGHAVDWITKT